MNSETSRNAACDAGEGGLSKPQREKPILIFPGFLASKFFPAFLLS
jgi:hypothetical protein